MKTSIELSLWKALGQASPEKAFSSVYQETSRLVWTVCFRILKSQEDASDAYQGTYARLFQLVQSEEQPPQGHSVESLMMRLAVLEADRLRKQRGRRQDKEVAVENYQGIEQEASNLEEQLVHQQMREKLELVIEELPENLRVPVVLHYLDGVPQTQIAQALGVSPVAIHKRLKRALEELRPKCRRVGLQELSTALAAVAGMQALLSPPVVLAEGVVLQGALQLSQSAGLSPLSVSVLEPVKGAVLLGGKAVLLMAVGLIAVISITTMAVVGHHRAKNSLSTEGDRLAERRGSASITDQSTDRNHRSLSMQGGNGDLDSDDPQEEEGEGEEVLSPGYARVSFQALWEDTKEPVKNATLVVNQLESEKTTDGRGRVSVLVDLAKGEEREVSLSHPETMSWREKINVTEEEAHTVYLREAAFLSGTLVYEDDERIAAGKPVLITTLSEKNGPLIDVKEVVTNENGRYLAKLNEENRYLVTVNDGEYIGRTKEGERLVINAKGGETVEAPTLYIQKGGGIYGAILINKGSLWRE